MDIEHPTIGICGLSCRLCPRHHAECASRCGGCKTESRMSAGCPFITCALKRKGIEFCWDCQENETCKKWKRHREYGKRADSFKCYQKLEEDIAFVQKHGEEEFQKAQQIRELLLIGMLREYNEGRSKGYYCIVATVMETGELEGALAIANENSNGLGILEKSRVLHSILDEIAKEKNYILKLRK